MNIVYFINEAVDNHTRSSECHVSNNIDLVCNIVISILSVIYFAAVFMALARKVIYFWGS